MTEMACQLTDCQISTNIATFFTQLIYRGDSLLTLILFIYGACLGSWLVAMATRYATAASIVYPASHCDTCQTPLTAWQLVPVISYLVLRGRCHYCEAVIPAETLLAEVSGGLLLTTISPSHFQAVFWLGLWAFAALCDARTQTFPGWLSWGSLLLALWGQPPLLLLLGSLLFAAIRLLWPRWTTPSIGDGDLDMMLSYSLLWGLTATAHWLLVACLLAFTHRSLAPRAPFIPYLSLSSLLWWLVP